VSWSQDSEKGYANSKLTTQLGAMFSPK